MERLRNPAYLGERGDVWEQRKRIDASVDLDVALALEVINATERGEIYES